MAVLLVKVIHLLRHSTMIIETLCQSPETSKYDLSSIRLLLFGAAPFPGELTERLATVVPNAHIGQGFGR